MGGITYVTPFEHEGDAFSPLIRFKSLPLSIQTIKCETPYIGTPDLNLYCLKISKTRILGGMRGYNMDREGNCLEHKNIHFFVARASSVECKCLQ